MRSHIRRKSSSPPSGGGVRGSRLAQPVIPHIRSISPQRTQGNTRSVSLDYKFLNSVFQMERVEVDQQADGFAAKFQVRNDLGLMNQRARLDRFEFNHYSIFHDKIETITGI